MTIARPDVDPELRSLLDALPAMPALGAKTLEAIRAFARTPVEPHLEDRAVERREVSVAGADGAAIPLSVFAPPGASRAPCVYWIHGGGMVMGDRFSQIDIPLEWLDELGAVVASVDYRLAPEATGTALVDDCYAGLAWVVAHADELGVDPARVVVAGTSAGGGLAAGLALMARDLGAPAIAAQVLVCPMLDHRNDTVSSRQFSGPAVWSREANAFGWASVLGGTERVSGYVSPSVADDLSGLPPAYVDAGTAEVFRDEDVAYAGRIWAAGGQAELHVWAGGVHGFDALFPQTALAGEARRARSAWLARVLRR